MTYSVKTIYFLGGRLSETEKRDAAARGAAAESEAVGAEEAAEEVEEAAETSSEEDGEPAKKKKKKPVKKKKRLQPVRGSARLKSMIEMSQEERSKIEKQQEGLVTKCAINFLGKEGNAIMSEIWEAQGARPRNLSAEEFDGLKQEAHKCQCQLHDLLVQMGKQPPSRLVLAKSSDEFIFGKAENICGFCGKRLSDSLSIEQHFEKFHAEKKSVKNQCQICGKWLKSGKALAEHRRISCQNPPKFKCEKGCRKEEDNSPIYFATQKLLEAHNKRRHSSGEKSFNPKQATCPSCGVSGRWKHLYTFKDHTRVCEGKKGVVSKKLQCPKCQAEFSELKRLNYHAKHYPDCDKSKITDE
jgi:hypothetical protein